MKNDDLIASISRRIHEVKEKSGLNGLDFYRKAVPLSVVSDDTARNNVSAWGNPKSKKLPSVEEFIAIAENFGVSLDWLLMGRGDSAASGEDGGKFNDLTEKDIGQLLFVELPRRFPCYYKDGCPLTTDEIEEARMCGALGDWRHGGVEIAIDMGNYASLTQGASDVVTVENAHITTEIKRLAIAGVLGKLSATQKIPIRNGANGVKSGVKEE